MHLFYTPDIPPDSKFFLLSEEESKHAIRVLRLLVGDQIQLVDGRGGLYSATITDAHPKRTVLEISDTIHAYQKRNHQLHIAIAPTKNMDRVEWFLEKATEVGIDEITPIVCERSERKEAKVERLTKVMVSAMKQSIKAYLPKLNEPMKFEQLLSSGFVGKKFIAHCDDGDKRYLDKVLDPSEDALILIGPEGDFTPREIEAAMAKGFHPITLGSARLRTETAALAACLEVALLNREEIPVRR